MTICAPRKVRSSRFFQNHVCKNDVNKKICAESAPGQPLGRGSGVVACNGTCQVTSSRGTAQKTTM